MLWISIILLEFIIIGVIAYFLVKLIKKKESKINIERSVKEGMKSAIKELEEEKNQEEELMKLLKSKNTAIGIFSSNDRVEEPINTTDLIPANLTDSEKDILRMFYNQ